MEKNISIHILENKSIYFGGDFITNIFYYFFYQKQIKVKLNNIDLTYTSQ